MLLLDNVKFFKGLYKDFPSGPVVKNTPTNSGDTALIPGSGRPICHRTTTPVCHKHWSPYTQSSCSETREATALHY